MKISLVVSLCLLCAMFGKAVLAAPGTVCTVTTTGVSFGSYDPLSSPSTYLNSTGTITVSCNRYTLVAIGIGASSNSGAFHPRAMKRTSGSDLINYDLCQNVNCTTIWGDGTAFPALSQYVSKNPSWVAQVYGRAPGGQDVAVGSYGESLVVLINY